MAADPNVIQKMPAVRYEANTGITPSTLDEAWRMAQLFARSELVPKDYRERPENCLVAMQMGAEVGFKPLQALQGIAVINGRPSVWGDALWALVQNSPLVENATESFDDATMTATCTLKRRGREKAVTVRFSKADAEKANLWGKSGPWTQYPKRMLQMRARAFAARDAVPDVLKGLAVAEEVMDIPPERDVTAQSTHTFVEQPTERVVSAPPPASAPKSDVADAPAPESQGEAPLSSPPAPPSGSDGGGASPLDAPLTEPQKRIVRASLARSDRTEIDLKAKFGKGVDDLTKADFNRVAAWLHE